MKQTKKTTRRAAATKKTSAPVMTEAPVASVSAPRATSSYSLESLIHFVNDNFVLLLVAALLFAGGFFSGSLWTENQLMRSGNVAGAATGGAVPTAAAPAGPEGPTADQLALVPEVSANEHIRGNKNAKVYLIEYSDFECPFCARFHPTTQEVLDEYGDDVAIVYRHYPLPFHPNAQKAAEASECVAKLGGNDAFWKYADAVFAENDKLGGRLTPEAITASAEASGVNVAAFQTCLDSGEMAQVVADQMTAASSAGVTGTPGSFVVTDDGAQEIIAGALPFAQVQTILQKYL